MKAAAKAFCRHWELRLELFSEEKAFLPFTLSGALKDDVTMLLDDRFPGYHFYGAEDNFGRGLVCLKGMRYCPTEDYRLSMVGRILIDLNFSRLFCEGYE